MRHTLVALALAAALLAPGFASAQLGSDYYYRSPTVTETYAPSTSTLVDANERQRNRLVAGVVNALLARPHPLSFALFPIGEGATELVLVSRRDGQLDTPYRARAMLEVMNVLTRSSRFVSSLGLDDSVGFLDMLHMLGFTGVTISDGAGYTHHFMIVVSPDVAD